jgi:hypothetical protein
MNMWRVGEDMGSKETDGCPLTSPIMWIPIYGRLGTRRLGTVFLCISFVV